MDYLQTDIKKHKTFMYLKDINDFPCIVPMSHQKTIHTEGQITIKRQEIRGYTFEEDPNELAQKIEDSLINHHKVRVLEVSTDEKLLHPYGVTDLTVEIINDEKN